MIWVGGLKLGLAAAINKAETLQTANEKEQQRNLNKYYTKSKKNP